MNVRASVVASKPPFRAEHIGSLLRPAGVDAVERARFARGEIDQAALTAAEDGAIRGVIRLQERPRLQICYRRRIPPPLLSQLLLPAARRAQPSTRSAAAMRPKAPRRVSGRAAAAARSRLARIVNSRVQWTHPINAGDVAFLKANSKVLPKVTIPGPCALHFRGGDAAVTALAYKDTDLFWADIVEAFTKELSALAAAGCRYVQIDETAFAKFGDPDVQAMLSARGDDWSSLIDTYIGVTNRILNAAPAELHIGLHLCRGNRGGHWHAEGSYEEVAERLFNALDIPFYFLEYDTPRAGSFTPLRFVPKHKAVVLGLVSTKVTELEDKPSLRRLVRRCGQIRDAGQASRQSAMRLRQRRYRQSGDGGGAKTQA